MRSWAAYRPPPTRHEPPGPRPGRGPPPTRPARPPPPTARREHPAAERTPRGRHGGTSDPAHTRSPLSFALPDPPSNAQSLRADTVLPLSPYATPHRVGAA